VTMNTDFLELKERQMLSRLLYANPVCILTTSSLCAAKDNDSSMSDKVSSFNKDNAMVVTWLTPVDNNANIFLSINSKRYTMSRLKAGWDFANDAIDKDEAHKREIPVSFDHFVLNIPVAGQEDMVIRTGSCSGRDIDKFAIDTSSSRSQMFSLCRPGWLAAGEDLSTNKAAEPAVKDVLHSGIIGSTSSPVTVEVRAQSTRIPLKKLKKERIRVEESKKFDSLVAIRECVAHIVCRICEIVPDFGSKPCSPLDPSEPSSGRQLHGHYRIFARMERAFVRKAYWDRRYGVLRSPQRLPSQNSRQIIQNDQDSDSHVTTQLSGNESDLQTGDEHYKPDYCDRGPGDESNSTTEFPPLLSFLGNKQFARIV
jgi:hypothetical protein